MVKRDQCALLSAVFYQFMLLLGDYVLFGGFELEDEDLGVSGVKAKISECISDRDFIFYYRHE